MTFFDRLQEPIMSDTCFKCHGPGTRKAKFQGLDQRLTGVEGAAPVKALLA
jgi:hypothetical protein